MNSLARFSARVLNRAGLGRAALRALHSEPTILLYHGVVTEAQAGITNSSGKQVDAGLFNEHMTVLARHRRIVPLDDLVRRLQEGIDCRNMMAITFDDGYLDNLHCAAPILERLGLHATFFLATGFIGAGRWMWQDLLESALNQCSERQVHSELLGKTVSLDGVQAKLMFLRQIKTVLKQQPWQEAERQAAGVAAALGAEHGAPSASYRFMSWDDARELVKRGFGIGAHTVNHAILSRIDFEDACSEILDSQQRVMTETGVSNRVFCYPNGKTWDYTPQLVEFCRSHFDAALSTRWGCARPSAMYELARIVVDNESQTSTLAGWVAEAR